MTNTSTTPRVPHGGLLVPQRDTDRPPPLLCTDCRSSANNCSIQAELVDVPCAVREDLQNDDVEGWRRERVQLVLKLAQPWQQSYAR
ncbi:hypothetical protein ZHAS_00021057 [Anopheles sinensis]|uniref:Uncharacterized protein n=1 Tax=Anopheles sinensis TaxID=74873 RepID=A0A084WRE6_ANOSI|nr:hypothetical protein ZHAS_00021057 [Anopheles sinensis]